eukprot:1073332-Pyramimonas_sp.AAC.1
MEGKEAIGRYPPAGFKSKTMCTCSNLAKSQIPRRCTVGAPQLRVGSTGRQCPATRPKAIRSNGRASRELRDRDLQAADS